MKQVDAAVIGGGVLGCFAARNLRRWQLSTLLLEQAEDVCTGITRANSAIVYPGYDNRPGSLKAEMTVRANGAFDALCRELEVPFSRPGSLLVTYDPQTLPKLRRKLAHGRENGVPGLRLLSGREAQAMEPMLRPGVAGALYAPTTGTVNPWQLGIAAYENALANGAQALLNTAVTAISQTDQGYLLKTTGEDIRCRVVLNCAGLQSHRVQALCFPTDLRLRLDGAEFLVLDKLARKPEHILFHQAAVCGKGITAIPCVEGNLLLSGVRKPAAAPFATTVEGLAELKADAKALLPQVDTDGVIRSFAALRPNPCRADGQSLPDFCIQNPAPGFYSLIGIKTPGLTCANELGMHLAQEAARHLGASRNPFFQPHRSSIARTDRQEVLCQCEGITREQVLEAIARGAVTLDGVKRRVGSGMGRCQGSRCSFAIEQLLEEARRGAL